MTTVVITAAVVTDDQQAAARAAEVLARAATGLVLDGINVSISMGVPEEEDEPV